MGLRQSREMRKSMPPRQWFAMAGQGFAELVDAIAPIDFESPGLGEWTVRDLIGHTARALSTVIDYLAKPVPPGKTWVTDAGAYFAAAAAGGVDHDAVAERGRAAGRELGPDPSATIRELRERAMTAITSAADDAPVAAVFGPMRLVDYLPTRAFELTVHTLDLAYALEVVAPEATMRCVPEALRLLAEIAGEDQAVIALRAITGRAALPPGFSLV